MQPPVESLDAASYVTASYAVAAVILTTLLVTTLWTWLAVRKDKKPTP